MEETDQKQEAAADSPPRRSWGRRLLKLALWSIAVVCVLLLVVVGLLQTDWGREQVRQIAVDALNGALAGEFSVERIEGNPLGTPRLVGFTARDPDGLVVLNADSVDVDMDLLALLDTTVHLREATVQGLRWNVRDEQGRMGLLRAFSPTSEDLLDDGTDDDTSPSPWVVRIDALELVDTVVNVSPGDAPDRIALSGLTLGGTIHYSSSGVRLQSLRGDGFISGLPGQQVALALALRTNTTIDDGVINVRRFKGTLGPVSIEASARIVVSGIEPLFDVSVTESSIALPELGAAFGLAVIPKAGTASVEAKLSGPLGRLAGHIFIEAPVGALRVAGVAGVVDAHPYFDVTMKGKGVAPHRLLTDLPTPLSTDLQGTVLGFGDPSGTGHLQASLTFSNLEGARGLPPQISLEAALAGGQLDALVHNDALTVAASGPLESPYFFDINTRSFDLGAYLGAVGVTGISADVEAMDGLGEIQLLPGSVGVLLAGDVALSDIKVTQGPQPILADAASGRVDFHYPGWGWPLGEFALTVHRVGVGELKPSLKATLSAGTPSAVAAPVDENDPMSRLRSAERISVRLETAPSDGGVAVTGAVSAMGVDTPQGRGGTIRVPVDVAMLDGDWRPVGTVGLKARAIATPNFRSQTIDAKLDLRRDNGRDHPALAVTGTFGVRALSAGGGLRVGVGNGRVSGWVDEAGDGSASVGLNASNVAVAGQTVASLKTSLRVKTFVDGSGSVAGVRLSGDLNAKQWSGPGGIGAATVGAVFDDLRVGGTPLPSGLITFDLGGAHALRPWGRLTGTAHLEGQGFIDVNVIGSGGAVDRAVNARIGLPVAGRSRTSVQLNQVQLRRRDGSGLLVRDARIEISRGGQIKASNLRLQELGSGSGNIVVNGTVGLGRGPMDLKVDADGISIVAWVGYVEDLTGTLLVLPKGLKGRFDLHGRLRRTRGVYAGNLRAKVSGGGVDVFEGLRGQLAVNLAGGELSIDGAVYEKSLARPFRFDALRVPMRVVTVAGKPAVKWGDLSQMSGLVEVPQIDINRFGKYLPASLVTSLTADRVSRTLGGSLRVRKRGSAGTGALIELYVENTEVRPDGGGKRTTTAKFEAWDDRTQLTVNRGRKKGDAQVAARLGVSYGVIALLHRGIRGETPKGGWSGLWERERETLLSTNIVGEVALQDFVLRELPGVPGKYGSVRVTAFGRRAAPAAKETGTGTRRSELVPLRFLGTLGNPKAEGWLVVDRIPLPGGTLGRVQARFDGVSADQYTELEIAAAGRALGVARVRLPAVVRQVATKGGVGNLLRDPGLRVELFTDALAASYFQSFAPSVAESLELAVPDGRTTLYARLEGSAAGPKLWLDGRVERREVAYVASLARSIQVTARIDEAGATVEAIADQGPDGGVLNLRAALKIGATTLLAADGVDKLMREPLVGHLRSNDFRLDQLEHAMPSVFGRSRGWIDADVALTGTAADPVLAGHADVRFDEVELEIVGRRTDKPFDVGLYFHDRVVELCRAPPRKSAPLVASTLAMIASAKPATPAVNKGSVKTLPTPNAGKVLQAKRSCDNVEFEHNGGTMSLALLVRLPSLKPEEMGLVGKAKLKGYELLDTKGLRLNADADLTIAGTVKRPSIKGAATVNTARYEPKIGGAELQRIGLPEDVRLVTNQVGSIPVAALGSERAPLQFESFPAEVDVTLTIPRRAVQIINPSIDAYPHGRVQAVTDADGTLLLKGRVWVDDGIFRPFDREFIFAEDSYVDFKGDPSVDPIIHIRATYSLEKVDLSSIGLTATSKSKIVASIDGKRGEIGEPDLVSDPPMTKDQMMSIVLLGTPSVATGLNPEALAEAALSALGVSQKIREGFFFLDRISIVPTVDSVRLHVGKELGPNLWGYYDFNLNAAADENQHVFRVEWRFTKGWRLETRLGDFAQGSFELLYRYQY